MPSGCAPYCSNENDLIGTFFGEQASISIRCCTSNNCNTDQIFNQVITQAPGVTQSPTSSGFKASANSFFTVLFSLLLKLAF